MATAIPIHPATAAGLTTIEARITGISPLLINRMTEEQLLALRTKTKRAKNAAVPTPREEAATKVHVNADGEPHIPLQMLMSCFINAGKFIRLDGKRQVSTAKSTILPGLLSILSTELLIRPAEWEVDIAQGRNPNGGEAVCIVRPRFDQWEFDVALGVDQSQVSIALMRELVDAAGARVGIGDHRPERRGTYGRFVVTQWDVQ